MKKLLLLFTIISQHFIFAQNTFQKKIGGGFFDVGNTIIQTTDSSYVIAGKTSSYGAGIDEAYIIKIDREGDTIWTKTFGGIERDEAFSIQQTSDNGFIISGSSASFNDVAGDLYLIKLDAAGDTTWTKTYGGNGMEWGVSVKQTFDGGYIVAGQTPAFGSGGWDVYLIKINSNGSIFWTKTYGESGGDFGYSVVQTADSGYAITGSTSSFGAGSDDIYLIKTDAAGIHQWSKTYGGTGEETGYTIYQTADGGYIIGGETNGYGMGVDDLFLLKTSASGVKQWMKTYGGTLSDGYGSMTLTSDGGYTLCGNSRSFSGAGDFDAYLIKTDSTGAILFTKTYGTPGNEYANGMDITYDGGYILTGSTTSNNAPFEEVYIVKTDASGNSGCSQFSTNTIALDAFVNAATTLTLTANGGTSFSPATQTGAGGTTSTLCFASAVNEFNNELAVKLYPNPFHENATLHISEFNNGVCLTIYNLMGKEVKKQFILNSSTLINRSGLPDGFYSYQISDERKEILRAGKFIVN